MTRAPALSLIHHDLCFGCGPINPFGLQMDIRRAANAVVVGRFFVKQDHQGPDGHAHPGVLAAAVQDAMAIATGDDAPHLLPVGLELDLLGAPARVGAFVRIEARVERRDGEETRVRAEARAEDEEGAVVARARARFRRAQPAEREG